MSDPAGVWHGREPSPPFDGSVRSFSSLSYSYDSSRSPSGSYSYSSSASSSSSDDHPRRGHGRLRARLLSEDTARKRPRSYSVLGDDLSYAAGHSALPAYNPSSSSGPVLPPVLGDAVLPEIHDGQLGSVLGAPDTPNEDWPCGVCSNINSKQRTSCFRCDCHYAESLMAMPSYEISLTHLPPGCTPATVEAAVRRAAPNCALQYIGTDTAKGIMYIQFSSVEEATRCLVQSHCELQLRDGEGEDAASVRVRLSFSLGPHPLHERKETEEQVARAAAQAEAGRREEALQKAGVPRFLWPHTWREPPPFPSAEKHKEFLSAMSTHWDHLSEEQKRYYNAEVKKALLKTAVSAEVMGKGNGTSGSSPPARSGEAVQPAVPLSTKSPLLSSSLAKSSEAKETGKTSHALDGLKKRLAERKSAMKKADGADGAKVSTASALALPTDVPSPGHGRDSISGGAAGLAFSLRGTDRDFPAIPSSVPAEVLLWDGFPVPLQYTSLCKVPCSIELPRVPMSHVAWDEQNLEANAEYQRQHPVTIHITEPKTPYPYADGDDLEEEEVASLKWDPAVNAKVKEIKERVTGDFSDRPKAPVTKAGRPMLAEGTVTGELARQQHQRDFQKMRKAVYADEGAMFKKALAHEGEYEDE